MIYEAGAENKTNIALEIILAFPVYISQGQSVISSTRVLNTCNLS